MDTLLDLFSTSQNDLCDPLPVDVPHEGKACKYNAPLFWYRTEHTIAAHIVQGNCHHWDCPRCGIERAKREYARIVNGVPLLARSQELWFMTFTCRGGDYTVKEATQQFGEMWNRLASALRADWKKQDLGEWHYVAITEKQQRGHPHLHVITTYAPSDRVQGARRRYRVVEGAKKWEWVDSWYSMYLLQRTVEAGFGEQVDFQPVRTAQGISYYLAKYLFKREAFLDIYPKNWKRIRYSQKFPKLPLQKTDTRPLITSEHWRDLAQQVGFVIAHGEYVANECSYWLQGNDVWMTVK